MKNTLTVRDRVIIAHAKRIKKLEDDLRLANARLRALEARPPLVFSWPAQTTMLTPSPWATMPDLRPYCGDSIDNQATGAITLNGKPIELIRRQE